MDRINQIFSFIAKLFDWWFMVMPWEQAIFIRAGKNSKLLYAGLYLKIPFIDTIYIQTTRMRMIDVPIQTMSTKCGKTVTLKSAIKYEIEDVLMLYNKMCHPEMTLQSMAMSLISEFVNKTNVEEAAPPLIEKYVNENINGQQFGLKNLEIKLTNFAIVRTIRLIQDYSGMSEGLNMEAKRMNI